MKASELRNILDTLIEKYGDLNIVVSPSPDNDYQHIGWVYSDKITYHTVEKEVEEQVFKMETR